MNLNGLQQRRGRRCGARDAARPGAAGSVPAPARPWAGTKTWWEKGKGTGCGTRLHSCDPSDGVHLRLLFTRISKERSEEAEERPCYCAPGLQLGRGQGKGVCGATQPLLCRRTACPRGADSCLSIYHSPGARLARRRLTPTLPRPLRARLGLRSAN